jgi:hypothetical protein
MITDDEVMTLLSQADPARAAEMAPPGDAGRFLDTVMARGIDVALTEIVPRPTERERGHRRLLTAAAVALCLLAASALALLGRDDAKPASTPIQPTPLEVANGFVEAYSTYDTDAAARWLADETTPPQPWRPPYLFAGPDGDWRLGVRFMEATGIKIIVTSCHEQVTTPLGAVVRCPFAYHALGSDELGHGPYGGSAMDLTISNGKIVAAAVALQTNGFITEMAAPFNAWLRASYPNQIEVLYTDATMTRFRITEESVPAWQQRTREYIDAVRTGTTPTT